MVTSHLRGAARIVLSLMVFAAMQATSAGQATQLARPTGDPPRGSFHYDPAVQPVDFQQLPKPGVEANWESGLGIDDSETQFSGLESESPVRSWLNFGDGWLDGLKQQLGGIDLPRVLGSLAIVLGGYFGFVWMTRRFGGQSQGLPTEVVEVLGHSPFGTRKSLQLVRLGSKLLLLMNEGERTQSVGEITDPHEVDYLVSLCGDKPKRRSAIAIGKASASPPSGNSDSDLKKILRKLDGVAANVNKSSVFEA